MRLLTVLPLLFAACSSEDGLRVIANPLRGQPGSNVEAVTAAAPHPGSSPKWVRRFKPLRDGPFTGPAGPPSDAQITLGRMLFFDKRLSKTQDVSCNSCHPLDTYGVTHERVSRGAGNTKGKRNAPSVYFAAGQFALDWDGRAADVEAQVWGPLLAPSEMANDGPAQLEGRLKAIPGYVEAFARAFPAESAPLSYEHVGVALGAFERGLAAPSRWDKYLRGDPAALSNLELDGLRLFTNLGCAVCHTGELVGGTRFETAGVVEPWPNQRDLGRYEVTHVAGDKMVFKVPSLRDVAKTAPYFHDGSARTLPEAVTTMARYQLGQELEDDEVQALVAWLGSLTGELPAGYIAPPPLPPDPPGVPR